MMGIALEQVENTVRGENSGNQYFLLFAYTQKSMDCLVKGFGLTTFLFSSDGCGN